jgi:hypothetical protein
MQILLFQFSDHPLDLIQAALPEDVTWARVVLDSHKD